MNVDPLLRAFSLKSLKLRNRLVMAPMTRSMSKNNIPGKNVAEYYRRRAEGGVGLIITEGTCIDHQAAQGYPDVPNFHGEEALKGWREVVDQVHAHQGCIAPQLWHVGSMRQKKQHANEGVDNPKHTCSHFDVPGYAPSAVPHPGVINGEIPHEMSQKDILDVIEAFAKAAGDAKKLGFDAIEIHGAHGYLIDQFFWSRTNKRNDEYGGKSLPERMRFAIEVVEAVRGAVGGDLPISFRFSQWKLGDYKAKLFENPDDLDQFLSRLVPAGVDIFHCSTRRFWEPEFPDSQLNLAGWAKKLSGRPAITVGSVGLDSDFVSDLKMGQSEHPSHVAAKEHFRSLMQSLEKGEFDLVAVGRSLLADPQWLKKIEKNHFEQIHAFSPDLLKTLI